MNYYTELEDMYGRVYGCDGKCACFSECSKKMKNSAKINCCKLKIGSDYGLNIPKIMFVGKEGVNQAATIESPVKVSEVKSNNTHYFGTIHTLAYILKRITSDEFCNRDIINQSSLSQFDDLHTKFCLTNYYKCAFRDKDDGNHNVKTNNVMKKNCPIVLTNEIEILKPNIIIMQGKFSTTKFDGQKGTLLSICQPCSDVENENLKSNLKNQKGNISVGKYTYNETKEPVYIIWSYHPCAHGNMWFNTINKFQNAIDAVLNDIK